MKDMTIEELLDDLSSYSDVSDEYYKLKDEILRQFENLKCCGNCKHSYPHCCRGGYCSNWTTDGMTREEREGK